jgi:hypothetical protein
VIVWYYTMKVFRLLVIVQATYTLITAVWPIVHIESFMEATGYKTDVWLVKTVGALLIPVSSCLIAYLFINTDRRPAMILGGLSSIAFICIDFYYSLTDVIWDIYMADGFLQIIFLSAWVYIGLKRYDMLVDKK